MFVLVEYLTVLALIALFATLLLAGSVVLVGLGQGINAVLRIARKSTGPAIAKQIRLSAALQPAILTSSDSVAR